MSNGNVGLYPTADHWCFGRCYLQSWSTCHILTAVFLRFTRNMTIEIGSLEIWLLAGGHRPRPQTKAEDFKCQLLMHCTLRIYIMNCNLQWWGTQFFFFTCFIFVGFFSFDFFLWMYLFKSWYKYLICCLSLRMTKEISSSCRCTLKIQRLSMQMHLAFRNEYKQLDIYK